MGFCTTTTTCPEVEDLSRRRRDVPLKNRVGNFRGTPSTRAGQFAAQPLEPHWETCSTSTKTVSGLSCWPSRDPIGEEDSRNLFLFVGNSPETRVDVFGLYKFIGPFPVPEEGDLPESPCTCCCVENISITQSPPGGGKIKDWAGTPRYCHEFTVAATTSAKSGTVPGGCKYEWSEIVTRDSTEGTGTIPPGYGLFPMESGMIAPGDSWSEDDSPGLGIVPKDKTSHRTLFIIITVRSAPRCPCAKTQKKASIMQKLKLVNGVPDKSFEDFKVLIY